MILYLYPNVYEKKSTAYIYNFLVLITNTIWQEQVYPSQYFLNNLFDSFSTGWKQFHIFLYYFFVHERYMTTWPGARQWNTKHNCFKNTQVGLQSDNLCTNFQ